jgi:gamma-glutamylputrescine oxidase
MFSYWENDFYFTNTHFLIVGAGFTGLWTALALRNKYPNKKILIVDQGIIPTGASGKNAGFSCFGSATELIAQAQLNGKEAMWQLTHKRFKGLQKINNTFSAASINYNNNYGYDCITKQDTELVMESLAWLNNDFFNLTGNKNTFVLDKLSKHGIINFDAIVKNKLEGSLHPVKLLNQL